MNEGKPGGKNEMPRNAKTRIWRVRFCPPEHMNMLSGRTRTSHPGGQGQVTRENKKAFSRVTKIGGPEGGKDVVLAIEAMHRVPAPWHQGHGGRNPRLSW